MRTAEEIRFVRDSTWEDGARELLDEYATLLEAVEKGNRFALFAARVSLGAGKHELNARIKKGIARGRGE